jgi:hypothetical protein
MIVLCGGMYRSGSTLQYNLASNIIERKQMGARVPYGDYQSDPNAYISSLVSTSPLYQVLKVHELPLAALPLIRERSAKCLSVYRDIRDVVASWQAKTRMRLSVNAGLDFARGAVRAFTNWENLSGADCIVFRYEDMINNVPSACQKVADFLNLEISPSQVSDICHKCSIDSMSGRLETLMDSEITRCAGMAWDSHTLVHLDHLNGGIVGRARKELDDDLLFSLEDEFGEWIVQHGYTRTLRVPNPCGSQG